MCRAELDAGKVEASSRASQAQRLEAQHKEMHDRLAHAQSALADVSERATDLVPIPARPIAGLGSPGEGVGMRCLLAG